MGLAKAKLFNEKYGAKLEFLEGWEWCKPKNCVGGGGGGCGEGIIGYCLEPRTPSSCVH